jgi:tetratricopeptide (TPR) repeat protein
MVKLSVDKALLKAKSHAKRGEVAEALELYQAILCEFPKNKNAQRGLSALRTIKLEDPTKNPPQETITQLINLYKLGQLSVAAEKAGALVDQFPEAHTVWNILGAANMGLGKMFEASAAFQRVTTLNPNDPDGYNNLGVTFQDQGRLDEAIKAYKKALSLKPDFAAAYNNTGNALTGQGKLDEAIEAYKKALSLEPDYVDAYYNMGFSLQAQGNHDEAIQAYDKAIARKPDHANAYSNIGLSLSEQDKLDEAKEAYKKALALKPDFAEAYSGMGATLHYQGKLEEAKEAYEKALLLKPDFAEAYDNMGATLKDQGKLDEAIGNHTKAIALSPDYAEAHFNLASCLNLKGELRRGFQHYEWRLRKKKPTAREPRKTLSWDGAAPLTDKKFVVYQEQGLGDIIQFCRYLPLLELQGADVVFDVTPKLHALLRTLDSKVQLIDSFPADKKNDFEAPLMSLPHLFNTSLDTIPFSKSYLHADQSKIKFWNDQLDNGGFKIGICWQGSKQKIDIGRSFPLSLFKGISEISEVELISLHKGDGERQIQDINFELTTFDDSFDTGKDAFIDTAAVMMNCDLIITSDTAVAHLAGALGCRTWVALQYVPDWRWLLGRSDSPWYPNMRLYRQKQRGEWGYVFDMLQRDLKSLL